MARETRGPTEGRETVDSRGRETADGRGAVASQGTDRPAGPQKTDRPVGQGAEARRREEYGGVNIGAAFFGWLVAIGMAALLTALVSAAGAAIGLTSLSGPEAQSDAGTIGIVGGALLVLVLLLAYLAGGYVAGRMSRYDGARQGVGVWVFGLLVTILLAIAGAVLGAEYNLLQQLDLPRIPVDEGSLATGGVIALLAILIATLIGAILGGKLGERYHRKVDQVGHSA